MVMPAGGLLGVVAAGMLVVPLLGVVVGVADGWGVEEGMGTGTGNGNGDAVEEDGVDCAWAAKG